MADQSGLATWPRAADETRIAISAAHDDEGNLEEVSAPTEKQLAMFE